MDRLSKFIDPAHVANRCAAREMKKADERQAEHERHEGPTSDSTKDAAYPALQNRYAKVVRPLCHASPC
jgi:hypothetical protein